MSFPSNWAIDDAVDMELDQTLTLGLFIEKARLAFYVLAEFYRDALCRADLTGGQVDAE